MRKYFDDKPTRQKSVLTCTDSRTCQKHYENDDVLMLHPSVSIRIYKRPRKIHPCVWVEIIIIVFFSWIRFCFNNSTSSCHEIGSLKIGPFTLHVPTGTSECLFKPKIWKEIIITRITTCIFLFSIVSESFVMQLLCVMWNANF